MINEIKKLVDELNSYRMKYYNGEDTGVTDEEFDFKERRLKELDPNNQYFYQVGAKTQTRDIPVEHEYPMLSMQKEQTAEAVVDWFFDIQQKFPNLYFEDGIPSLWYEPKFDGISGKIVYDQEGNYKLKVAFDYDDTLTDEKLLALSTDKLEEMYKCIQEANVINTKAQSYVSLCKMGLLKQ